jgi:hypothetical protein
MKIACRDYAAWCRDPAVVPPRGLMPTSCCSAKSGANFSPPVTPGFTRSSVSRPGRDGVAEGSDSRMSVGESGGERWPRTKLKPRSVCERMTPRTPAGSNGRALP